MVHPLIWIGGSIYDQIMNATLKKDIAATGAIYNTYKVHPHYDAINVCKLKPGAATSPYLPLSIGFQRCGIHTIPTDHRCVL
jgi:hypothetical protein